MRGRHLAAERHGRRGETLAAWYLRLKGWRIVARRVQTKYAAKLKFLADESFDEGSHIDKLLRSDHVAQDLGEE